MKMKRTWRKVIARVLTTVMLVSIFSTVDMGWNVKEVKAATYSMQSLVDEVSSWRCLQPGDIVEDDYVDKSSGIGTKYQLTVMIDNQDQYVTDRYQVLNKYGHLYITNAYKNHSGGADYRAFLVLSTNFSKEVNGNFLASAATCTSPAKYYYKCPRCNQKLTGVAPYEDGKALGHSYSQATCIKKATCSGCGATSGDPLGHTFNRYSTSGNSIIVKCQRNSACGQQLTYTLDPKDCKNEIPYTNRDSYVGATFSKVGSGNPSVTAPTAVSYRGVNGTSYSSTTKPNKSGSYEAYISMNGMEVKSAFSIAPGGDIYKFDKGDTSATGTMSDQLVLKEGFREGTKLNKNQFQKIGYAFEKWLSSIPEEEFIDEAVVSEPNLDNPKTRTLTAQWKANDYTVTFDNNGADKSQGIQSETVTYDETLPLIETSDLPEKNCSDFLGYFTDKTSGVKVYDADGKPAITNWTTPNNTTLYAHWNINHNWGYEAEGNEIIATCKNETCKYSQKLTLNAEDSTYDKNSSYSGASITNQTDFPKKKYLIDIQYKGTTAKGVTYPKSSTAPQNAGTYEAMVTVNSNGTDYTAKKSFTIDKATQNATVSVAGYKWGEDDVQSQDHKPTINDLEEDTIATVEYFYNENNSNENGTPWISLTNETLDAGTFYVYAEYTETDNYKSGKTPAKDFRVLGKEISSAIIKTTRYSGTYDRKPHTIDLKIEGDGIDPTEYTVTYSDSEDGSYSVTKPEFTNAGNYHVCYKVKTFGYEVASGSVPVDIAKKKITISGIKADNKVYDSTTDAVLNYKDVKYTGIESGDVLSVTATGTFEDENFGDDKNVAISGLTLDGASKDNYELAPEVEQQSGAKANITQREVTLAWGDTSFAYDGNAKKPTATAGNVISGDTCNVTAEVDGGNAINAGEYTARATALDNPNYKLPSTVTQIFTINKINQPEVTVTMSGFEYSADPVPTPSVSGDAKENPDITYYYSLENKTTGGTLWDKDNPPALEPDTYYMYAVLSETTNYKSYTTEAVQFIVNGQNMNDRVNADNKTVTYTGTKVHGITVNAPADATVKYGTSEGNYNLSVSPTYKDVNVDGYTVYYKVTKTGYNPVKGSAEVVIKKAPLTVTPDSGQTKVYGDADPAFTYTVSGLLGSDTASVVTGTLKRDTGENVTSEGYELSKNDDMTADNYDITCTSGVKFKITPRDLTAGMITLTKKKFEKAEGVIDVSAGGNIVVKYKDVVRAVGTDYVITGGNTEYEIGTYYVTIEGRGNFKGSVDKEWKITNAIVPNVSAISFEGPYDGNSHTIAISGTVDGDIITYGISEDAIDQESVSFINAGTHTVWYKVARGNYEPFEASATVTINPKEISVTWGSTSLVYNGMTQAPQATASGLIGSDVCEVIVTGSDVKDVGSYTATATGVSNVNYKLPDSKPTTGFKIIPKPITVTGKNASKYVNKADPVLTYVAQSVCAGDVLSGVIVTRDAGESVGSYPIRVTVNDSLNPNYAITTQNGTFTIKNPEPKEEPRDDGNSGNNTTPVVNAPIVKPNIQLPEALAPVVNKAETTTNTKAKEAESEPVGDEDVDLNAGKLTLHVEVLEESPIKKAEVSNQVGELLDNSDVFTLGEVAAIKNGENARVWVSVDKMDMSKISSDEQKQLTEVAKSIEGDDVKLLYFDINMFKQIGSSEIFAIREPGTLIKVSIELPEYAINLDEHMEREYKVLRLHDGEITVLDTEYDPATRMLTFATDKFSTYVFAYVDKPVDEENAENAASTDEISVSKVADDASSLNVWLFIIPVIIIAGIICAIIIYRKKREDDMTV